MTQFDNTRVTIAVIGSLNMDMALHVSRAPAAGETITAQSFHQLPGGKGANQAVACARLGARVAMVGRVGADDFGAALRNNLHEAGIDSTHVSVDAFIGSGLAMIMVDDDAQNRIAVLPGANGALLPAHIDAASALIEQAALIVLQLEIPLTTALRAIERAVAAGTPVLLNPAPAQPLPTTLWRSIDYLVANETEANILTDLPVHDPHSAAAAARQLLGHGARHIFITLGSQGVVIADSTGIRHYPALPVRAIDTTAAGDAFIGGLAAGLCEGKTVDAAAQIGIVAASICVTRQGAQSAIPYRAELTEHALPRTEIQQ